MSKNDSKPGTHIKPHLITATTGMLEVVALPSDVSENWLLPTNIILDQLPQTTHLDSVSWQGLKLPVFSLVAPEKKPSQLLVIEGESDLERFALSIKGDVVQRRVRLSDLPDTTVDAPHELSVQYVMFSGSAHLIPDTNKLLIALDAT